MEYQVARVEYRGATNVWCLSFHSNSNSADFIRDVIRRAIGERTAGLIYSAEDSVYRSYYLMLRSMLAVCALDTVSGLWCPYFDIDTNARALSSLALPIAKCIKAARRFVLTSITPLHATSAYPSVLHPTLQTP